MHDVELLRLILLYLETRQTSPRSTVIIDLRDEAEEIESEMPEFANGLNFLQDLDYIEGPGQEADGVWLFRKLTRKGVEFVRASRDPGDWEKMKRAQAARGFV